MKRHKITSVIFFRMFPTFNILSFWQFTLNVFEVSIELKWNSYTIFRCLNSLQEHYDYQPTYKRNPAGSIFIRDFAREVQKKQFRNKFQCKLLHEFLWIDQRNSESSSKQQHTVCLTNGKKDISVSVICSLTAHNKSKYIQKEKISCTHHMGFCLVDPTQKTERTE